MTSPQAAKSHQLGGIWQIKTLCLKITSQLPHPGFLKKKKKDFKVNVFILTLTSFSLVYESQCLSLCHVRVRFPSHIKKTGVVKLTLREMLPGIRMRWLQFGMLSVQCWCFAFLFRARSGVCRSTQKNWRQTEFPAETSESNIQALPLGNLTAAWSLLMTRLL